LDKREKYYAGIIESQWKKWFMKFPTKYKPEGITILDKVGIGGKKIERIIKVIAKENGFDNVNKFRVKLHKDYVVESIQKGFLKTDDKIFSLNRKNYYTLIFNEAFTVIGKYRPNTYFERCLFPGMTVDDIWDTYHGDHLL